MWTHHQASYYNQKTTTLSLTRSPELTLQHIHLLFSLFKLIVPSSRYPLLPPPPAHSACGAFWRHGRHFFSNMHILALFRSPQIAPSLACSRVFALLSMTCSSFCCRSIRMQLQFPKRDKKRGRARLIFTHTQKQRLCGGSCQWTTSEAQFALRASFAVSWRVEEPEEGELQGGDGNVVAFMAGVEVWISSLAAWKQKQLLIGVDPRPNIIHNS